MRPRPGAPSHTRCRLDVLPRGPLRPKLPKAREAPRTGHLGWASPSGKSRHLWPPAGLAQRQGRGRGLPVPQPPQPPGRRDHRRGSALHAPRSGSETLLAGQVCAAGFAMTGKVPQTLLIALPREGAGRGWDAGASPRPEHPGSTCPGPHPQLRPLRPRASHLQARTPTGPSAETALPVVCWASASHPSLPAKQGGAAEGMKPHKRASPVLSAQAFWGKASGDSPYSANPKPHSSGVPRKPRSQKPPSADPYAGTRLLDGKPGGTEDTWENPPHTHSKAL